jgi:hypothetical protein
MTIHLIWSILGLRGAIKGAGGSEFSLDVCVRAHQ